MDTLCNNLRFSEKTPNERPNLAAVDVDNKKAIENPNLEYIMMTKGCLVDRLKQHLATIEGTDGEYDERRYYNQAHDMLKIGAFKPVPYFIVCLTDLSPELIHELHSLDTIDCAFVLHQAVGRIFEDVNFEIYHNSVSRVLRVKLVK